MKYRISFVPSAFTRLRFLADTGLTLYKKVSDIPVPSRDVTYQTLSFFPGITSRESLVSDIPLGTGMFLTFFYGVQYPLLGN
jgi:hypothetical protein